MRPGTGAWCLAAHSRSPGVAPKYVAAAYAASQFATLKRPTIRLEAAVEIDVLGAQVRKDCHLEVGGSDALELQRVGAGLDDGHVEPRLAHFGQRALHDRRFWRGVVGSVRTYLVADPGVDRRQPACLQAVRFENGRQEMGG